MGKCQPHQTRTGKEGRTNAADNLEGIECESVVENTFLFCIQPVLTGFPPLAAVSRAIDGAVRSEKFVKGRFNVLEKGLSRLLFKLKRRKKDVKPPFWLVAPIEPRHQWTRLTAAKRGKPVKTG